MVKARKPPCFWANPQSPPSDEFRAGGCPAACHSHETMLGQRKMRFRGQGALALLRELWQVLISGLALSER